MTVVESLRSTLPYQHGRVESALIRAVVHGLFQSSAITNCVTTMDVMEGGGLGPVVFFVLIVVGLFGIHAPLPFHPFVTTTTTVKLIVF